MNLSNELDKRRDAASQITGWCIVISLNQNLGIGHIRLDRVFAKAADIAEIYRGRKLSYGRSNADGYLLGLISEKCKCTEFRVPVLKSPRSRKEQQIRMAENDSATTTWRIYAAACIEALGYSEDRLKRLHDATWSNYEQFVTEWYDVGEDVAVEHVRRCAEQALHDNLYVESEKEEPITLFTGLTSEEKTALRIRLSSSMTKRAPAGIPLAAPSPDALDGLFKSYLSDSLHRFPKK